MRTTLAKARGYRKKANFTRREFLATSATVTALFFAERSWSQSTDPTELSIAEAARLIRSRDLSPVELTRAYLERIARLDPRINSFITVIDELALARAQRMEAELDRGRWWGPLHGIPIGLKDNIDTAGVLTTAGSAVFADRVPKENAEVVRRLTEAGAVLLGKLNMHEFAYGTTSAVSHFGPVHNPWHLDRIPGGSSGGSAAAVAARLCAGALGTDTGGSIRIPAAHCGIVGLKPTYGLASIRGIVPLSVTRDHVGPMCRTVEDAALMLQALVGYDPRGIASIRAELPNYVTALQRRTSELRLGLPRSPFYEELDSEISSAVSEALRVLRDLSATTQEVVLPARPGPETTFVEAYAYHSDYLDEKRELYGELTLERILQGRDIPATEYAKLLYQTKLGRKAIAQVFEEVDLLVTPTVSQLPIPIDKALQANVDSPRPLLRNTAPFNFYGIPTISVPCGVSRNGLPIGLQISGPALGELEVLALAHAYEQATRWHERKMPLV